MKRVIISMFVALLATVTVQAQQIAVVSGSTTTMCQTLAEAIGAATNGSVIYLPGGGFQIADDVAITKQLSIIGIGHKSSGNNTDGNTTISKNIHFGNGSRGSAIMGCYIAGNVIIEDDNVMIKYCNLDTVIVKNSSISGTIVNQNYLRGFSKFNNAGGTITNNVMHSIKDVDGGIISNNIITANSYIAFEHNKAIYANNSTISNNVFLAPGRGCVEGNGCLISENMLQGTVGDDCINLTGISWSDVFVNHLSSIPTSSSDYHFKEEYSKYENQVGIYAGSGFSDSGMAPVPFIEAKDIPDKTDAAGMLKIKIRVKASE